MEWKNIKELISRFSTFKFPTLTCLRIPFWFSYSRFLPPLSSSLTHHYSRREHLSPTPSVSYNDLAQVKRLWGANQMTAKERVAPKGQGTGRVRHRAF
jgi:hypothetical protein